MTWRSTNQLEPSIHPTSAPYPTPSSDALFENSTGLLIFGFFLCLTHLNVVASPANKRCDFFGLALGFVLFAGLLAFGDTETAMYNPGTPLA